MGEEVKAVGKETYITRQTVVFGVKYERTGDGGTCPNCGEKKCRISRSMPWEKVGRGKAVTRVRYHICPRCGTRFKSIEEAR
jgi:YgiT-type zinc finger domain-containing protein